MIKAAKLKAAKLWGLRMILKIIFLSLSLSFSLATLTSWANDESNSEAQVIGQVSQVVKIVDGCSVKIGAFRYYREHILRPLYQDEVLRQEIFLSVRQCSGLRVGDEISGVLIADEDSIILED